MNVKKLTDMNKFISSYNVTLTVKSIKFYTNIYIDIISVN
ncbi:hypothetical protein CLOSBL3_12936 [Clostridiaceae bacterium BL-3]|nr:hypothetical protein CLOSBL3_12936 [Clostridiaceae bacterium BL-3]